MCAAILDNVFGIDRPTAAPTPTAIAPLPPQIANPNAASSVDLTPSDDTPRSKRRGTSSLRIDRTVASSGLNIPQA